MSEKGGGFDRSFADLMAGVAVVFLLLAVVFILEANRQRNAAIREKEVTVGRVERQKMEVQDSLTQLRTDLSEIDMRLDGGFLALSNLDGGVNFLEVEFKDLQFASGRCRPPDEYTMQLEQESVNLIREVCRAVDAMRSAGAEPTIILEGHTDDKPFLTLSRECGIAEAQVRHSFENNVRASAARAQEVFFTIRRQLGDAGYERTCLDQNFVVSGRGQAAPRDGLDASEPSNRRLVIRVRGDLRL